MPAIDLFRSGSRNRAVPHSRYWTSSTRYLQARKWREGVSAEEVRHETARDQAVGRVYLWPTVKPIEEPEQDAWEAPVDVEPKWSPVVQLASKVATEFQNGRTGAHFCPVMRFLSDQATSWC